jgi:hypothetical protein
MLVVSHRKPEMQRWTLEIPAHIPCELAGMELNRLAEKMKPPKIGRHYEKISHSPTGKIVIDCTEDFISRAQRTIPWLLKAYPDESLLAVYAVFPKDHKPFEIVKRLKIFAQEFLMSKDFSRFKIGPTHFLVKTTPRGVRLLKRLFKVEITEVKQ